MNSSLWYFWECYICTLAETRFRLPPELFHLLRCQAGFKAIIMSPAQVTFFDPEGRAPVSSIGSDTESRLTERYRETAVHR